MKPYPLLAALLATTACKKEQSELEKLPAATQTGSGAGAFLLDGKAWLPDQSNLIGGRGGYKAKWSRTIGGPTLQLTFSKYSDRTGLNLYIPGIRQLGTFQLDQRVSSTVTYGTYAYGLYQMSQSLTVPRVFLTGPNATGSVIVTRFDTVGRVVSGTFDIMVKEETSSETHHLSEGRFDYTF